MNYTRHLLESKGRFLDKKSYKELFPELKQDRFYELFYLENNNEFITIGEDLQRGEILQDQVLIRKYSEMYLKTILPSADFIPIEKEIGIEYQSDIKDLTVEIVIAKGQELEIKESVLIYYFKQFDFFVAIELIPTSDEIIVDKKFGYVFQDNSLRKKYNIPYQDERFQELLL